MKETWLVAVSAGPDSMALLHMCMAEGMNIAVAHVNYHHRIEADEEESYIRNFCREHEIVCHVKNELFVNGGNFEADARSWRYGFFVELVKQYGYKGVLVAHHEDDLIETYLMQEKSNIVPSYYGLKEDLMYQGILVHRPLLHYTKQELLNYCSEHHLKYYVDSTNLEDDLTRNQIRHHLVEPMNRFTRDMVLKEIASKNAEMQERRCRVKTYIRNDRVNIEQYRYLSEIDQLTMLRMLVDDTQKHSLDHLKEMNHIICTHSDFMIDINSKILVQDRGWMFLTEPGADYEFVINSQAELEEIVSPYFKIMAGETGLFGVTVCEADYPLVIRNAREGDFIELRFGKKKISRFFIDRHIPKYLRKSWPVLLNSSGDIILVSGLGCDINHYSISPSFSVLQCSLSGGFYEFKK